MGTPLFRQPLSIASAPCMMVAMGQDEFPAIPSRSMDGASDGARDAALVARVRAGEAEALEQLFRAHYRGLCGHARHYVRSAAVAEEAVQEVFRRLWQHKEQWTVPGTIRAWLYKAVQNQSLNILKHHRVEERWVERETRAGTSHAGGSGSADYGPHTGDTPLRVVRPVDEAFETAELARAIEQVIAELPARCRTVFLLKWRDELSYAEIAQVLDISVKTVDSQLMRALHRIRERLGPDAG